MKHHRCRLLFAAFCLLAPALADVAVAAAPNPKKTRLVVLIVIDQLRADYLTHFADHFGPNGFRRLTRGGAHFVNAYFSYGASATAPGHATISTGRIPRQHGIVANKWYLEPDARGAQYAVSDARCQMVPAPATGKGKGRSPRSLIGPTLGDQIKVSDIRSRVFSVSLKDRAAILMGGHMADGAFWWDLRTGHFVSSTYYAATLPDYIARLNKQNVADRYVGKSWHRLLDAAAYAGCRPINPAWPGYLAGLGPTFPHVLPAVVGRPRYPFYAALWTTPFGNDLVLDAAEQILTHEKLGRGPAVDMLCISLSANDLVGHFFGPDSPEVMDVTVQTDRQIAGLLNKLDEQVGLEHCLIALTGDHGVTSTPAMTQELRLGGGRVDLKGLSKQLDKRLRRWLGPAAKSMEGRRIVSGTELPWVYLDRSLLERLGAKQRRGLINQAAEFFRGVDGVAKVFTADELSGPMPAPADLHRYLAWRCYNAERSGQVYLQLAPYWYKADNKIAGHSSGFNHDRHVPILLFGPRMVPGRYFSPAKPSDIAVTLAAVLGIEPPLDATGDVLYEALDHRPMD